jgi:hypothetical protein
MALACRHSGAASQYAQQLFAVMDALVAAARAGHAAGVAGGLQAVLQAVQDMGSTEGHMYQEAMQARLALLAAACWLPPASATAAAAATAAQAASRTAVAPSGTTHQAVQAVQAVQETPELARLLLDFCWQQLFHLRQCSVALRTALCKHLLLPLLQLAPPQQRQHFYQQHLKHSYEAAEGKSEAMVALAGRELLVLSARACAYRLLETMYRWAAVQRMAVSSDYFLCSVEATCGGSGGNRAAWCGCCLHSEAPPSQSVVIWIDISPLLCESVPACPSAPHRCCSKADLAQLGTALPAKNILTQAVEDYRGLPDSTELQEAAAEVSSLLGTPGADSCIRERYPGLMLACCEQVGAV